MNFVFGFAITVAWLPLIIEPATTPRWAVAAALAPLVLMLNAEGIPRPLRGWGALGVFSLAIGCLWAPDGLTGLEELAHRAVLVAVFLAGAALADLRRVWIGLAAGLSVSVVIAIAQRLGWEGIQQAAPPAGLFYNRNMLAEAALVVLAGGLGFRIWWAVALGALAIALCASKAVLGAAGLLIAILCWERVRAASWGILGCVILAAWWYAGSDSLLARLEVWKAAFEGLSIFGRGLGSFATDFPRFEHAHLDALQLAYEHGVLALPLVGILLYLWRPSSEPEQLVLTGVLAVGLLSFPLHMPLTACAFALAAGHAARRRAFVRALERDAPAPLRWCDFWAGVHAGRARAAAR